MDRDLHLGRIVGGTHSIKLIADPYNQLSEINETNNEKEATLIIE